MIWALATTPLLLFSSLVNLAWAAGELETELLVSPETAVIKSIEGLAKCAEDGTVYTLKGGVEFEGKDLEMVVLPVVKVAAVKAKKAGKKGEVPVFSVQVRGQAHKCTLFVGNGHEHFQKAKFATYKGTLGDTFSLESPVIALAFTGGGREMTQLERAYVYAKCKEAKEGQACIKVLRPDSMNAKLEAEQAALKG